ELRRTAPVLHHQDGATGPNVPTEQAGVTAFQVPQHTWHRSEHRPPLVDPPPVVEPHADQEQYGALLVKLSRVTPGEYGTGHRSPPQDVFSNTVTGACACSRFGALPRRVFRCRAPCRTRRLELKHTARQTIVVVRWEPLNNLVSVPIEYAVGSGGCRPRD